MEIVLVQSVGATPGSSLRECTCSQSGLLLVATALVAVATPARTDPGEANKDADAAAPFIRAVPVEVDVKDVATVAPEEVSPAVVDDVSEIVVGTSVLMEAAGSENPPDPKVKGSLVPPITVVE